jgi:hypothetical protein
MRTPNEGTSDFVERTATTMNTDTILGIALGSVCGLALMGALALLVFGTIYKTRFGINFSAPKCAECGASVPSVARIPKTPYQMLWGGWTCEECGLELDKWGDPR